MLEREATYAASKRKGHRLTTEFLDVPGLRYVVNLRGYSHATGTVNDLLLAKGRVELVPGVRSPVQVIDAATERRLEGVRFLHPEHGVVASTDEEGRAVLEGLAAEGRLSIEAPGYAPRRWYASWPGSLIPLAPL